MNKPGSWAAGQFGTPGSRCLAGQGDDTEAVPNQLAGLVLASGLARRFEPGNKLLKSVGGIPLVRRTVEAYLGAGLSAVYVVVGHDADRIASALTGLDVRVVENPEFEQGQSRALVRGVRALPQETEAAVIGVADQPFLSADIIRRLVDLFWTAGAPLAVPRYASRRGNPVVFGRRLFPELLQVTGDQGGRPVLERHSREIAWLDVADPLPGADIDTDDDYRRLTVSDE